MKFYLHVTIIYATGHAFVSFLFQMSFHFVLIIKKKIYYLIKVFIKNKCQSKSYLYEKYFYNWNCFCIYYIRKIYPRALNYKHCNYPYNFGLCGRLLYFSEKNKFLRNCVFILFRYRIVHFYENTNIILLLNIIYIKASIQCHCKLFLTKKWFRHIFINA